MLLYILKRQSQLGGVISTTDEEISWLSAKCHGLISTVRSLTSSNLLAAAAVFFGKALHPHCLIVLRKGLKAVDPMPWLLAYQQLTFLVEGI